MPIVLRGRVGLVAFVVALVLGLGLLGGAAAYGTAYGSLAWWKDPARISWCGRVYLPSANQVLTLAMVEQLRGSLGGDPPFPLVQVERIPPLVGHPVLASVVPQATRDRLNVPCAMIVYLETGSDSYRPYVLSGGP
jgi:hypothetical protein